MKRIFFIFTIAFILNVVWENIHVFLYGSYMGGKITELILIRASLFDATMITVILIPFLYLSFFKNKTWLIVIIGTIIAIFNEWYGLSTERWIYNAYMPILPIIRTGLTPTLQLGLLGYITYKFQSTKAL